MGTIIIVETGCNKIFQNIKTQVQTALRKI